MTMDMRSTVGTGVWKMKGNFNSEKQRKAAWIVRFNGKHSTTHNDKVKIVFLEIFANILKIKNLKLFMKVFRNPL